MTNFSTFHEKRFGNTEEAASNEPADRSIDIIVNRGQILDMSKDEISSVAIALPLAERVALAQTLWESIGAGVPDASNEDLMREVMRRDGELESGAVKGRSHEEVMAAARDAIRCA